MSEVTFEDTCKVRVDGKHVGDIVPVKDVTGIIGYQYKVKGSAHRGRVMNTMDAVKRVLLED